MTKHRKRREREPAPPPPRPRSGPPPVLAACACFALALVLYWGALRNPLVFDDRLLREDFLRLYAASWFHFDLRWLSHATFGWGYGIFRMDWFWHRLVNVLLHAATAVTLFVFLARLFRTVLPAPVVPARHGTLDPAWIAFFGALLFLLHPAAVYGVAYLAERPVVMATLFSLLCLLLFLEGLLRQSQRWYIAAAVAYLLAVFSKEHSVMVPAVALALAILVRGASARLLRELAIPFALFTGIGVLVVLRAKGILGAPYEPAAQALLEQMHETRPAPEAPAAYPLSVVNQGYLFFRYLLIWLVPYTGWMSIDLRVPFPAQLLGWPHTLGFAAWLVYPVAAIALLRKGGRSGLVGFGLLYPWLLGLTEMATVRVQEPFVIYRSYLWMSGLPVLLAPALCRVRTRWSAAILGAACVALVPALFDRLDSFSSQTKLWTDVVLKNSGVQAALVERGYHNRGLAYLQAKQYTDALQDFDRALEINARDASALVGRGTLFARTGSLDKALADLGRAIEIDPQYAEAYAKRCFAKMLLEHPRDALPDCEKAVALNPRHRDAQTNLGVVYAALSRTGDAEASYRRALAIEPSNPDANYNYGVLLAVLRRSDEARPYLTRACEARIRDACSLLAAVGRAR